MLNPELDFDRYWSLFKRDGRVQIPNILMPDVAGKLRHCLLEQITWQLAIRDSEGRSRVVDADDIQDVSSDAYQAQIQSAQQRAMDRYGFLYESYMMIRAYREGRDRDLIVHRVLEYMNSEAFIGFCRTVAGNPDIRRVSAQATRYRPGMFLRTHNDHDPQEDRVVAYVFNLGKNWQSDWGGLLQFMDEQDSVVDTFVPRYNSLSLFRVPVSHSVTMVMPWASEPRLGITGWWETLRGTM